MAGEITVSSTTDSQEAVNQAAAFKSDKLVTSQPEEATTEQRSEAEQAETEAESEPAEKPEKEEPEEDEPEEEQPEQAVGKTRRKLLRQVSRLNSRNVTLQEQLEEANIRLRKLERGGEEKPPAEAAPSGKPDPRDAKFKTYEDYVEALADYKLEQKEKAKAQAAQEEYLRGIFDDYNKQVEGARDLHDDFDDVVDQSVAVPIVAINAMYEMDNGAEVAYYLGKHPDVRDQLLEWNTPGTKGGYRRIIVELNKISEELSGNGSASTPTRNSQNSRPRTQAPAPIRPVSGASNTKSSVDPGSMSYQDYKKWWSKTHNGASH
jgi:hypothetical protein